MALELTIYPESSPSPYQRSRPKAPDIVNDDFLNGFADCLDVINPLQHIPVVSDIYQSLTGDKMSVGAEIAGGALFGGPIGFFLSLVDVIFEQENGQGVTETLFAAATGKYEQANSLS